MLKRLGNRLASVPGYDVSCMSLSAHLIRSIANESDIDRNCGVYR